MALYHAIWPRCNQIWGLQPAQPRPPLVINPLLGQYTNGSRYIWFYGLVFNVWDVYHLGVYRRHISLDMALAGALIAPMRSWGHSQQGTNPEIMNLNQPTLHGNYDMYGCRAR